MFKQSKHKRQSERTSWTSNALTRWLIALLMVVIVSLTAYYYAQNWLTHARVHFDELTEDSFVALGNEQFATKIDQKETVHGVVIGMQRQFEDHIEVQKPTLISSLLLNPELERGLLVEYMPSTITMNDPANLPQLVATIQEQADQPMDFLIVIDFDKVRPLIESIGSLTVQVPHELTIDQTTYASNQYLNLTPRQLMQVLKPEQVTDSEVLSHQQLAVLEQIGQLLNDWRRIPKLYTYLENAQPSVETSLSFDYVLSLLRSGYLTEINYVKHLIIDDSPRALEELHQQIEIMSHSKESTADSFELFNE